jgi:dolichol-phosphate mannosyltransferase
MTSCPLTVVMPAYNEERSVGEAVADVQRFVLDGVAGSKCIVVDDGSTDGTGPVIDALSKQDGRITVIHQANAGHGPAVMRGVEAAGGDYVLLVDSDQQIPLCAFSALWNAAQGCDGAFGKRKKRHDPLSRKILTTCVRFALLVLFGQWIYDANIPFKIFKKTIWDAYRRLIPENTLTPSLFFALYVRAHGCAIGTVIVPHNERQFGISTLRAWKLFRFSLRSLVQLFAFRKALGHEEAT